MKLSIFFVNIIVHVALMALFVTIFFFTIAQYFERKIVEDQINFIVDDFVGNSLKPVSKETKSQIQKQINNDFKKINFHAADNQVKEQNQKVSKKAWIFVGILIGIIFLVVIILGFIFRWEPYYIRFLINSSVLSLIFVAITETLFMFLIAQNYLSADPSKIKLKVLEVLKNNTCDPCKSKKDECFGSIMTKC